MSAASALIEMSAERGGAAPRNRQEHFDVLPGDPLTASLKEGFEGVLGKACDECRTR